MPLSKGPDQTPNMPEEIRGTLRRHMIEVPRCIENATGIRIFGKTIRSLAFTTDVAVIKNINADAIIAVYPFTPQPAITHAIMMAADVPVFCGVGGGTTMGKRVVNLALDAEFQGAIGVVLNAPTLMRPSERSGYHRYSHCCYCSIREHRFKARMEAGHHTERLGSQETVDIIKKIRDQLPNVPIIATGGPNEETIMATIEAGANAITYTPPTPGELFKTLMEKYRQQLA